MQTQTPGNAHSRLSQFISGNTERILEEFEAFARDLVTPGSMDIEALRDHASAILEVIVRDLDTPQTKREGKDKAKGRTDSGLTAADTPAQAHGSDRVYSGFSVGEMVSEYRALRASVIRLWKEDAGELQAEDVVDIIRFNEAIDQALAESTGRFMCELDRTRDTFLGILGHDLRSPIGAVVTSAQFLLDESELDKPTRDMVTAILGSGRRMNEMVSDLLDFTRSRLGVAIPIILERVNFGEVIHSAVEEMKASRPGSHITLTTSGNLEGQWDAARLRQVLSNLLSNALNHGGAKGPIIAAATGEDDRISFSIHNDGPPIPADKIGHIFEPLTRHPTMSMDPQHLGLGLYIADQVVSGHGGKIEVESSVEGGTTFTVRLPRHPPSVA